MSKQILCIYYNICICRLSFVSGLFSLTWINVGIIIRLVLNGRECGFSCFTVAANGAMIEPWYVRIGTIQYI
ncbi:hypothetical protein RJT34_33219 [Clitoria ternatea]|uniref:Uncharacterized protein n=1 Tax=Clitoria ternatea TaxID=43366 RepID=A0AAN9I4G0_CLITE